METAKEVGSAVTAPATAPATQSTTQATVSTAPPTPAVSTLPPAPAPAQAAPVSKANGLNISPGQAIMFFIKHPNVFVVVANSGQDFMMARTFNEKWVKGLRPIGDELAPVLDELLPSNSPSSTGGTSGIMSLPANQTEDTLAEELIVKLNGMPTALGADPSGKPRRFNGAIIKEVAGFFLSNILPILLKTMLPGA